MSKKLSKGELQKLAATIIIKVKNENADPHQEIQSLGLHPNLMEQLGHLVNVGTFLDKFKDTEGDEREVSFPLVDTEKFIGNPDKPLGPDNPVKGIMKQKATITKRQLGPMELDMPLPNLEETKQEEPEQEEPEGEEKEASESVVTLSKEKIAAAIEQLQDASYTKGLLYLSTLNSIGRSIKTGSAEIELIEKYCESERVFKDILKISDLQEYKSVTSKTASTWKVYPKETYILQVKELEKLSEQLVEDEKGIVYLTRLLQGK